MKERGEEAARGVESAADATPPPPLLPLVQADGTKSIMYKDVKRNGSEMPDGVRMNGEDGGGVVGGRGRKRGTMGARAKVEEGRQRGRCGV